jgi:uncharacterized membrane protein YgcG
MTLAPDPASVLVHERLEQAVSAMPAPDIEAGWAALVAQLDVPLAPVVALRKPKRGRTVALAVAAAMMLAAGALATVAHFGEGRSNQIAPVVTPAFGLVTGPHAHAPFAGPPADSGPIHHRDGGGTGGSTSGSTDGGGTAGSSGGGDGTPKPGDDPKDRDQGTGNDGRHNDQGGGNNGAEGTQPDSSGGSPHGGSHH